MGNAPSAAAPPYNTPTQVATCLSAHRPTLLAFLSPSCGLCKSLQADLQEVEESGALAVARINAMQDTQWAPEMLAYNVEAVPCFVVLDPDGQARGKSGPPRSKQQMQQALGELVASAAQQEQQPRRRRSRH